MNKQIDLKEAINAISDVVQNRPRPLREFDQIHMKSGDMVFQSEIVADWADGKRLAFIGDGDAISVCVAYLQASDVLPFGPAHITVFDFDERTVNAVTRFAEAAGITNLDARLYNVLDALPDVEPYDCFYTNPPWGASNNGESVNIFVERGIEACRHGGEGMIVIADDDELDWPKQVLASVQRRAPANRWHPICSRRISARHRPQFRLRRPNRSRHLRRQASRMPGRSRNARVPAKRRRCRGAPARRRLPLKQPFRPPRPASPHRRK